MLTCVSGCSQATYLMIRHYRMNIKARATNRKVPPNYLHEARHITEPIQKCEQILRR